MNHTDTIRTDVSKPTRVDAALSARQWKIPYKGGIHFLWGVFRSTYWFELVYHDDIQLIDYVYYWMGFAAWGIRMTAWTKKRVTQPAT
jgi:hypothetical protein